MKKDDPLWFRFFPAEFLGRTMAMSDTEGWAYVRLRCQIWLEGGRIVGNDTAIAGRLGIGTKTLAKIRPALERMFTIEGQTWTDQTLTKELDDAKWRRERASKGGTATKAKREASASSGASSTHLSECLESASSTALSTGSSTPSSTRTLPLPLPKEQNQDPPTPQPPAPPTALELAALDSALLDLGFGREDMQRIRLRGVMTAERIRGWLEKHAGKESPTAYVAALVRTTCGLPQRGKVRTANDRLLELQAQQKGTR